MKYLILAILLAAQTTQEPYPGQSEHQKPPEGWVCMPQNYELSVPEAHACSCERSYNDQGAIVEDKECTVWCHMDHCTCPITNADHDDTPVNPFEEPR